MNQQDDIKLIEVFTGEFWQASMIETILLDNNIQAFVKNGLMGTIEPWVVTAGGSNPVGVVVSTSDKEAALNLIEEFNNSEAVDETND